MPFPQNSNCLLLLLLGLFSFGLCFSDRRPGLYLCVFVKCHVYLPVFRNCRQNQECNRHWKFKPSNFSELIVCPRTRMEYIYKAILKYPNFKKLCLPQLSTKQLAGARMVCCDAMLRSCRSLVSRERSMSFLASEPHNHFMTMVAEFRLQASLCPFWCQPPRDPEVPWAWRFSSCDMYLAMLNLQNLRAAEKRAHH